jgi:hypothetical protein
MLVELFSRGLIWTLVSVVATLYYFFEKQQPIFPAVHDYPWDFFCRKAYRAYNENARKLVTEGLAKHGGPIIMFVPGGMKIVLPSALSDWVKTNRDLDHQELVREEYLAHFRGFEAQTPLHSPDIMLIDLLRTKLTQNEEILPTVYEHISPALQYH